MTRRVRVRSLCCYFEAAACWLIWQRQEDSNHHQRFWRPPLYPLSYALMKRAPPEKTPRCSPKTYTSITRCRNSVRSRPRLSGVSIHHTQPRCGKIIAKVKTVMVLVAGLEPATLLPGCGALPTELHQHDGNRNCTGDTG